jgi:hypothetical protein
MLPNEEVVGNGSARVRPCYMGGSIRVTVGGSRREWECGSVREGGRDGV